MASNIFFWILELRQNLFDLQRGLSFSFRYNIQKQYIEVLVADLGAKELEKSIVPVSSKDCFSVPSTC